MPTIKISDLTELTATPASDDVAVVVDSSTNETKKISYTNLLKNVSSETVTATTTATFSGATTTFAGGSVTFSGATVADGGTVTTVDINGGTIDGSVIGGTTAAAGSFTTLSLGGTAITSTASEINILDGVTATAAEINKLDGLTATTTELNKLDGFTGTITDLNYAKDLRATGVTTTEFDKLDGLTATTTELNYTDGVTSAIQTQINAKAPITSPQFAGTSLFNTASIPAGGVDGVSIEGTASVANTISNMGLSGGIGFYFKFFGSSAEVGSISTIGGSTTYATSSDYRLKENLSEMTGSVDRVKSMNPVNFNFIGESMTVDGFLAHEIQAIVPEAIVGEKDAVDDNGNPIYQGIDQSKLVPVLVAAIKELTARIEALEAGA